MIYDPAKHHRQSIRLKGYDYTTTGMYFITVCVYQRQCLFGELINSDMRLNQCGEIIVNEWSRSQLIRQEIELDSWVIMPNHFHGIVVINSNVGANGYSPPQPHDNSFQMKPRSLSSLMAGFKSVTTKQINILRNSPGLPVWQRNYYDHIIRNEESLTKIRQYILDNPLSWDKDRLNPNNPSK